jgi:hypothetical protein
MLMILARLVRSESFWAVVKVRSPHTGPEPGYPRLAKHSHTCLHNPLLRLYTIHVHASSTQPRWCPRVVRRCCIVGMIYRRQLTVA